jgi:Flp pilus assembly protein TadG
MIHLSSPIRRPARRGAAAVELAFLAPFLCFLFVCAVDYARVFYFAVTLQNCARNGAYYASDYPNNYNNFVNIYGYANLSDAVLRDAGNLSPTPTYTVYYGDSPNGPFTSTAGPANGGGYVQVTVYWTFQTITNYPGVPQTSTLARSSIMQVAPVTPNFP